MIFSFAIIGNFDISIAGLSKNAFQVFNNHCFTPNLGRAAAAHATGDPEGSFLLSTHALTTLARSVDTYM